MRKAIFLALAVVACSKEESPAVDSAATAAPPPAAPAMLTAADLRGTWNGTSKREGSDSVVTFTVVSTSDSTSAVVFANSTDSVSTTSRFDADSVIQTSEPYKDPTAPKGSPDVVFRSIGRMKDGKLVGMAYVSPAAKRDTVVARVNWEATRAP
jgi:hypothetical protein